ncbi:MAG: Smr/MutS family protein [Candidatus Cloacimonetes bacterium]|nr:Smr/MutS family protein [Candidatus Cloacimonadota bacterium]
MNTEDTEVKMDGFWCIPREFDGHLVFEAIARHLSRTSGLSVLKKNRISWGRQKMEMEQALVLAMEDWLISEPNPIGSRLREETEIKLRKSSLFLEREELAELALDGMDYVELQQAFLEKYPVLAAPELPDFAAWIDCVSYLGSIFNDRLEIKDTASDELLSIRKRILSLEKDVKLILRNIVKDVELSPFLQEEYWVELNGRFVLLMRTESRGRVKGVAHGTSHSGQTTYFEPQSLVDLNNGFEEMRQAERIEISRILSLCNQRVYALRQTFVKVVSRLKWLDVLRAKALYSMEINGCSPRISDDSDYEIFGFFHPFVNDCVTNDMLLKPKQKILVLSGPNAGGKTVTMKSLALCYYYAGLGLRVPARSCVLPSVDRVLYLMGDYQSLMDSLSSFAAHLARWKKVLSSATSQSILFVDEIMNATDPREGEALASHMLRYLGQVGVRAVISTHYNEVKNLALESEVFVNASMIFDPVELRPTYLLSVGVPGNSYGVQLAKKFGLPDSVIKGAEDTLGQGHFEMRDLLEEEKREIVRLRKLRDRNRELQSSLTSIRQKSEDILIRFEADRDRILAGLNLRMEKDLHRVFKAWEKRFRELQDNMPVNSDKSVLDSVSEVKQQFKVDYEKRLKHYQKQIQTRTHDTELSVGDWVKLPGSGRKARVIELHPNQKRLKVIADGVTVSLNRSDLDLKPHTQAPKAAGGVSVSRGEDIQEIDIRANAVEDALYDLELFLDQAVIRHLSRITIIHGKGVLKNAVLEFLRRNPLSAGCSLIADSEGATIVNLQEAI